MAGEFSTWGETARENSSGFLAVQPNLRFQGEYLDRETGLHYNLFRYYDPVSGRFTQVDPIGLAGGINLYQYAPNPLNWIDPWGLSFLEIVGDSAQATGKKFQGAEIYKFKSKVKVAETNFKKRGLLLS